METLINIPALAKIGLVFSSILILSRLKVHLGLCLFVGAGALGWLMGLTGPEILSGLGKSLVNHQTISLGSILVIILVLSRLMAESGQLDRIVAMFTDLVRNLKLVSLFMPAMIGLLPMPGGALFSAPMVESACSRTDMGPEAKSVVNYWFRHIWEYWWPLYPGVVLVVSLLGVDAWRFMAVQFPMTLVAMAAGMIFLFRDADNKDMTNDQKGSRDVKWKDLFREVLPILLVILTIPVVSIFEWVTGIDLPQLTSVFVGLGLCLFMVIFQNHIGLDRIFRAIVNKNIGLMFFLVLGIMSFQGLLVESRVITGVRVEMAEFGIPPLVLIVFLPFLTGLITGIAVGFVAASFPLVVPLIASRHGLDYLGYASLAYSFGFMGMMLSPVHLCFVVTTDYFSASLLKSYRHLLGPVLTILIISFLIFGLTRFWAV